MSSINNDICNCPIKGCNSKLGCNSSAYSSHIRDTHKSQAYKFDLYNSQDNFVSICNMCSTRRFVRGFHHHCRECSIYFHNRSELDKHLKDEHRKDYLETPCRKGLECNGLKDGIPCGFTHFDVEKFLRFASSEPGVNFTCKEDYIDDQYLQYGICPNEKPIDGIRCQSTICKHHHYRGRVKFLIQMRNRTRSTTNAVHETNPVNDSTFVSDFPSPPTLERVVSDFPSPPTLLRAESEYFSRPPALVRIRSEFSRSSELVQSDSFGMSTYELSPRNLMSEFEM